MYHVYIIQCSDGSLYTGVAKDIVHRLREHYHRLPRCAKYTRSHPMQSLRGLWQMESKTLAYQLEYWIKRLDRPHKDALLLHPEQAKVLIQSKHSNAPSLCSSASSQRTESQISTPCEPIQWVDAAQQHGIMQSVTQHLSTPKC